MDPFENASSTEIEELVAFLANLVRELDEHDLRILEWTTFSDESVDEKLRHDPRTVALQLSSKARDVCERCMQDWPAIKSFVRAKQAKKFAVDTADLELDEFLADDANLKLVWLAAQADPSWRGA